MQSELRIGLLIASIITLVFILNNVVKNKMNIHYSMIWIIWGACLVLISIFPEIVFFVGDILRIEMPSNTIFLIMIFLLYCLSYYIYMQISKHNEEIITLNYEIANLKKKVEELEKTHGK